MIDILYVAHNRLELTRESFAALRKNTNWAEVKTLYVHDDASTDGTLEWLRDEQFVWKHMGGVMDKHGTDFVLHETKLGSPVKAMLWYLEVGTEDRFAKVDNDLVVCPGWLDEMLRVMSANPEVDVLGMEPMLGSPKLPPAGIREATQAKFIGGKGLIRRRAFRYCRMSPGGRYGGFTEWQENHPKIVKAWITPDLPVFGLDQLPFEPWLSLEARYVEEGWQRHWPPYDEGATDYWEWWTPAFPELLG